MKNIITLSEAVERDLRAILKDSNAITSPECLKHSIMKSRFVAHFAELLAEANPTYHTATCNEFAALAFDAAVDKIYAVSSTAA